MKRLSVLVLLCLPLLAACEEEAICFYNCPDDPDLICGQEDMEPGQHSKCDEFAAQKCEENPEALVDFGGEVMSKLVTCGGNENCGLPDFCMNDWLPDDN